MQKKDMFSNKNGGQNEKFQISIGLLDKGYLSQLLMGHD